MPDWWTREGSDSTMMNMGDIYWYATCFGPSRAILRLQLHIDDCSGGRVPVPVVLLCWRFYRKWIAPAHRMAFSSHLLQPSISTIHYSFRCKLGSGKYQTSDIVHTSSWFRRDVQVCKGPASLGSTYLSTIPFFIPSQSISETEETLSYTSTLVMECLLDEIQAHMRGVQAVISVVVVVA